MNNCLCVKFIKKLFLPTLIITLGLFIMLFVFFPEECDLLFKTECSALF
jgi:hypothetical protein